MLSCIKRCICTNRFIKRKKETYILKLKNDKYYIGESTNVKKRIWVHKNNSGSAWTKKYDYIETINTPKINDNINFNELIHTLHMMKQYGIENVRGSMFTSPFPLSTNEKIIAAQLYADLYNLCRKCGGENHFITQCNNDTVKGWVHQFGGKLQFSTMNRNCISCDKDISSSPSNHKYCRYCFFK